MSASPLLDYALAAHAAGLCVYPPTQDGLKRPDARSWSEYQKRRTTVEELIRLYSDPQRTGIGYFCGAVSGGLVLFDFDDGASAWDAFETLVADNGLGEMWDRVKAGCLGRTPGGGYHALVRAPDAYDIDNAKLAQRLKRREEMRHDKDTRQVLIEIKAEGGYTVEPPSNGHVHASHGSYEQLQGGPATIATITADELQSLFHIGRMLDEIPRETFGAGPRPKGEATGNLPGHRFNADTTWEELLPRDGWTLDHRRGETSYWRRAGKERGQGHSASTNHKGSDLLWVFTTSTDLDADRSYDRFGYFAVTKHGGDFKAAARALAAQGYGEPATTIHPPGHNRSKGDGASEGVREDGGGAHFSAEEPIVAGVRCSDIGNAEQLAERIAKRFRAVPAGKCWRLYRHGRWQLDACNAVAEEAKQAILSLYPRLAELEDAKERKRLRDHIQRSESHRALQAAVALAATDPRIAAAESAFDARPQLLNVQNGTIDLLTGQLRPHDPEDLLTLQAPVRFDPEARAQRWHSFLLEILPEVGLRRWLQMFFGYAIAGDPVEQIVPIAFGDGQNGKSTLIDVVCGVLGHYATRSDIETFLAQRNGSGGNVATPDLARLQGVRLVFAAEPGAGRKLNVGRIKELSGGENIVARHLYGAPFEFAPQFVLWLSTNTKPTVPGNDPALWRRLRLVPFGVKVPEERRVLGLAKKILAEEASGVLNWMLEGLADWRSEGRLPAVDAIKEATEGYRSESDDVGRFLEQRCQIGEDFRVAATELYFAFAKWFAAETGGKPMTQTMFGRELTERGFDSYRDGATWRRGLALLPSPPLNEPQRGAQS